MRELAGSSNRIYPPWKFLDGSLSVMDFSYSKFPNLFSFTMRNGFFILLAISVLAASVAVAGESESDRYRSTAFPVGNPFYPLIAAPKEARTFISQYRMESDFPNATNVASVAYGGHYGLYRFTKTDGKSIWQISFTAALFAQFNLDQPSDDLVNADYTFGFTLTHRRGDFSGRLRLYHQSSHLGDEVLLNHSLPVEWRDINFEALEALIAYDWNRWRFYGGGEYIVRQAEGTGMEPPMLRTGVEYRGDNLSGRNVRFVGGLDLASRQELDWSIDTSFKAGFELGGREPEGRNLRVLLGIYSGHIPYGQFYTEKASSYGLELALSF